MLGLYTPPTGFHFMVRMVDNPNANTVDMSGKGPGGKLGKLMNSKVMKGLNKLGNLEYDNSFMEVSGMTATIQTETIQEGGVNDYAFKVPKGIEYSNLVLKRGLLTMNSDLQNWCEFGVKNEAGDFKYQLKDITLMLMNNYHLPIMAWKFENAFPVKYEISGFDAMSSKIMVENIEICYRKFTRDTSGIFGKAAMFNRAMQGASMATGSIQKAVNAASETIDRAVNSTTGQIEKMAEDIVDVKIDTPDIDGIDIDTGFDTY